MLQLDKLTKQLLPEEQALFEKLVNTEHPPKHATITRWKGYNIIPSFSPEVAEYAYNNWTPRQGDVFVVTFPKTGTLWTTEIVRQLLYPDEESNNLTRCLPLQLKCLEIAPREKFDLMDKLLISRRVMFSHLPAQLINVAKMREAKAKIVYVLRNPKDQIVSRLKFMRSHAFSNLEPLNSMLNSGWEKYLHHVMTGELPSNMKPGEWYPDHILSWYKYRDNKTVYFIYYEDMIKNLSKEVKGIADFLEVSLTEELLHKVVNACTIDNMRKTVTQASTGGAEVMARNIRKGGVGGWKDYFTVSQSERIDAIMEEKLKGTDIKFTYK